MNYYLLPYYSCINFGYCWVDNDPLIQLSLCLNQQRVDTYIYTTYFQKSSGVKEHRVLLSKLLIKFEFQPSNSEQTMMNL